jgi:hypothetical protein
MTLRATCPHCKKNYTLSEHNANQRVRCKSCGGSFGVPPMQDQGVLDLAPHAPESETPSPRGGRAPMPKTLVYDPPPKSTFRAWWLRVDVGPLDLNLWVFVIVLLPGSILLAVPATQWTATMTMLVVAMMLLIAGGFGFARAKFEEGVSILEAKVAIVPLVNILLFEREMRANWDAYRSAVYCQLRGFILLAALLVVAPIVGHDEPPVRRPPQTHAAHP